VCPGPDGILYTAEGCRTCNTCGFLLNCSLLLDAGTVVSALSLSEQQQIRYLNIPTSQNPILASPHLKPGNFFSLAGVEITPILVNHAVPTSRLNVQNHSSPHSSKAVTHTRQMRYRTKRLHPSRQNGALPNVSSKNHTNWGQTLFTKVPT